MLHPTAQRGPTLTLPDPVDVGSEADPVAPRPVTLQISLSTGVGVAPTALAAFDAALRQVGAGDVNLVRLSSVIPTGATLHHSPQIVQQPGWGDRLYCVYAEQHASNPGESAVAAVGWVHKDDGSGEGLFVEHEGTSEAEVADLVRASLASMTAGRGGGYTEPEMTLVSAECTGEPLCVLALASYQVQAWTA